MSKTYERAWREAIWGKHNLAGVARRAQGATKMRFFIVRHRDARECPLSLPQPVPPTRAERRSVRAASLSYVVL